MSLAVSLCGQRFQQLEVGHGRRGRAQLGRQRGRGVRARDRDHPEAGVGQLASELDVLERALVRHEPGDPDERLRLDGVRAGRLDEARDLDDAPRVGERGPRQFHLLDGLHDDGVGGAHAGLVEPQAPRRVREVLEREVVRPRAREHERAAPPGAECRGETDGGRAGPDHVDRCIRSLHGAPHVHGLARLRRRPAAGVRRALQDRQPGLIRVGSAPARGTRRAPREARAGPAPQRAARSAAPRRRGRAASPDRRARRRAASRWRRRDAARA